MAREVKRVRAKTERMIFFMIPPSMLKTVKRCEGQNTNTPPNTLILGKISKRLLCFFVLFFSLFVSSVTLAEEEPAKDFWHRETLTGNWGGVRQTWADHGIHFEFVYTADVFGNVSGGLQKKATYLDNIDMVLDIDAERLLHWKGASFHIYGVGNYGESPSEKAGDAQGISNIDSPNAWKLYEAWFQQNFFEDRLSFLVGLYDINSDFDSIQTATLFLNSSHGIGPDYSQSGLNGPSVFPNLSFGGRIRGEPIKNFYFQTAILDGVPGANDSETATDIQFNSGDGALIASEMGYIFPGSEEGTQKGKAAVGAWFYTSEFDDLLETDGDGNPVKRSGNFGVYGLGEYQVYRENAESDQGFSVFGRFGYANPKINRFKYYLGSGLAYKGAFPGRDEDVLGLAIATVFNGGRYRQSQTAAGSSTKKTEVNLELTYRIQVTPWFAVQPDIQYVIHPDTTSDVNHSLNIGSRFEIIF